MKGILRHAPLDHASVSDHAHQLVLQKSLPVESNGGNDQESKVGTEQQYQVDLRFHLKGTLLDAETGQPVSGVVVGFRSPSIPASSFFVGDSVDISKVDNSVAVKTTGWDGTFDLVYTASERDTLRYQFLFAWKSKALLWRYDTAPVARAIENDSTETMNVRTSVLKPEDYFPLEQGRQWIYVYQYDYQTYTPYPDTTFVPTKEHIAGTTTWTVKSVEESGGAKIYNIDAQYIDSTDASRNVQGSFRILESDSHVMTIGTNGTPANRLIFMDVQSIFAFQPFYRFHQSADPESIVLCPVITGLNIKRSVGITSVGTGVLAHTYSRLEGYTLRSTTKL